MQTILKSEWLKHFFTISFIRVNYNGLFSFWNLVVTAYWVLKVKTMVKLNEKWIVFKLDQEALKRVYLDASYVRFVLRIIYQSFSRTF